MSLETLITQSNQVVSLLDCRQFHEAVHLASNTMELFQQMTTLLPRRLSNTTPTSIDQCMLARGRAWNGAADYDIGEFTYQHGITMPLAMVEDPTRIPSILIFNSGLSHQLLASATHEPRLHQHLLEKSIKLYKLAYTIEQSEEYTNNSMFKMAVLNNLGVVCKIFGQEEEARKCFHYLVSMIMQLAQLGACDQMMDHLNGIWANVVLKNVAPAA